MTKSNINKFPNKRKTIIHCATVDTYSLKASGFLLRVINLSQKLLNGIIIFCDTSGIIRDSFIKSANTLV